MKRGKTTLSKREIKFEVIQCKTVNNYIFIKNAKDNKYLMWIQILSGLVGLIQIKIISFVGLNTYFNGNIINEILELLYKLNKTL